MSRSGSGATRTASPTVLSIQTSRSPSGTATTTGTTSIKASDRTPIRPQERYPAVVAEIKPGPAWQEIDAVKNGRVVLMPEYAKAWGYPMPEALALGELWMAKTLYPDRFADIDVQAEADAYYRAFYRTAYDPAK